MQPSTIAYAPTEQIKHRTYAQQIIKTIPLITSCVSK